MKLDPDVITNLLLSYHQQYKHVIHVNCNGTHNM